MPLQNRVTPFGDIVAVADRGTFTGNRGIIHDPATRTLLRRRWATTAWIVCLLEFKGAHRDVMSRRSWTELFFLDEATALAAGHRPCFFCRRDAAVAFRDAWARGRGGGRPSAAAMDRVLHDERLDGRAKRIHALPLPPAELPDGAMVAAGEDAFAIVRGVPYRWTASGYRRAGRLPALDGLLTPPATVAALAAGYRPVLHASLAAP
ncbi:MAG: hypothetical protein JNL66_23895 [Alphaproteobacteria bacterium]|nr:hypothetical protein [Alphaproteobacteria bacterium]